MNRIFQGVYIYVLLLYFVGASSSAVSAISRPLLGQNDKTGASKQTGKQQTSQNVSGKQKETPDRAPNPNDKRPLTPTPTKSQNIEGPNNRTSEGEKSDGEIREGDESKPININQKNKKNIDDEGYSLLTWILGSIGGLLIVGGTLTSGYFLYKNKQKAKAELSTTLSRLSHKTAEFDNHIRELRSVSKGLSEQIAAQKIELSRLRGSIQQSQASSYSVPKYTSAPPPPPKEEPLFPAMVENYLEKVRGNGTKVKYDYKERMLVQDEDGDGGLLIVRDDSLRTGDVFLIPSFGYFSTKSDYTNYFERYYDCTHPSGGNVWIREPATVTPINGGWQLAQKGELEVR